MAKKSPRSKRKGSPGYRDRKQIKGVRANRPGSLSGLAAQMGMSYPPIKRAPKYPRRTRSEA